MRHSGSSSAFPRGMPLILGLLAAALAAPPASCQSRAWTSVYNSGQVDYGKIVAVDTARDTLFVAGQTNGPPYGTGLDWLTIAYRASTGAQLWTARCIGAGTATDVPLGIAVCPDGDVVVVGYTISPTNKRLATAVKYGGTDGHLVWDKRYTREGLQDEYRGVKIDGQGYIYVAGVSRTVKTYQDIMTAKLNPDGTDAWRSIYHDLLVGKYENNAEGNAIAIDVDGNAFVTGYSTASGDSIATHKNLVVLKYTAGGAEAWAWIEYDYYGSIGLAIAVDHDGNPCAAGWSMLAIEPADYYTVKLSSGGGRLWRAIYDGPVSEADQALAVCVDPANNVIVTGKSTSGAVADGGTADDIATVKYSPAGALLWVNRYNAPGNIGEVGSAVVSDSAGNTYVVGTSRGVGTQGDLVTLCYAPDGSTVWQDIYSTLNDDDGYGVAVGTDGAVYAVGTIGSGHGDACTIKYAPTTHVPVGVPDGYTTDEDTALNVAAPGVLGNDTDPVPGTLTASLASPPTHGALTLSADGSFTYTPTGNYNGPDAFTYTVSDGTSSSPPTTVTITVTAVNDAPVAADDAYSVDAGQQLVVAAPGVVGNDTDVDGDALSAVLVTGPSHGSLALGADGSLTYTPDAGYSGPDQFTYSAFDGLASSVPATISITVRAVNHPPVAVDDAYSVNEDGQLVVPDAKGALQNDSDPDADRLSAVLDSKPAHGTVVLQPGGGFTYTPDPDFSGEDTFQYRASDGSASSAPATVRIQVNAVVENVTAQVSVLRGGFVRKPGTTSFLQKVTIKNTGGVAVGGPLYLVFDSLSAGVTVSGAAGVTSATTPAGSPYVLVQPGALAAGASVAVQVVFVNPSLAPITYVPRVLAGAGLR